MAHPVTDYAEAVVEGEVVAGQKVVWACERHLADLQRDDVYFDESAADRIITFYELVPHVKGEWAGDPIKLEPWQKFIVGSLFGWRRVDGLRRFREGFIQVARKNGKTTLLAPIGIYGLRFDDEPGAEIYSAATTRDQANEIFAPAKRMVIQSAHLDHENDLSTYRSSIVHEASFSKFEPLSSDYDYLDGKNPHMGLVDELHAHPDSGIWDVLEDGMGSRRQPLMVAITTAGFNQESFCYHYRNYCIDILDPRKPDFTDDAQFAYIAELDDDDDWTDESVWVKANPNIGVSVKVDSIRQRIAKARHMPSQRNRIICKRMNVWTKADSRWMDMGHWDESAGYDLEELDAVRKEMEGELCYSGLDLSSKIDITAYLKVFPRGDHFIVIPEFFIPEDTINERSRQDGVPYDAWVRQGLVRATEGNVVDYGAIEQLILADAEKFQLAEVAHDRWGATHLAQRMAAEGIAMIPMGQGYASMSEPMKELEKLILEKALVHFNHPVLRWMADNTVAVTDPAENIKPDKAKSKERIDGIVALIMAIDRAIRHEKARRESVYQKRGVIWI